jgi:ABC-type lipoprotein release transport system permease subunit
MDIDSSSHVGQTVSMTPQFEKQNNNSSDINITSTDDEKIAKNINKNITIGKRLADELNSEDVLL